MSNFRYKGTGEIINANARKEGKEEDGKTLALDVKLRVLMEKDVFDAFNAGKLKDALFNNIGAVENIFIEPISLSYTLREYCVEVAHEKFFGATLKKFTFEPKDGDQVSVTFTATISPQADEVARIMEYLADDVSLFIEPSNQELPISEGN